MNKCKIKGCEKKLYAAKLCKEHYTIEINNLKKESFRKIMTD